MEVMQKQKLFLATPMYGGQCSGMFTRSIQDVTTIFTRHNIPISIYYLFNESLITRARNYCSDEFMRSDCTHMMFIDSDLGFEANDVLSLLAMCCSDSNPYDVIGGPYPKKCISWEKVRMAVDKGYGDPQNPNENLRDASILENFIGDYVFNPRAGTASININEPCEVMEIGTGFMMIKRSAMDRFNERYPRYRFRPDHVRTAAFDGTRMVTQFFQAEIDQPDAYEYLMPALKKIAGDVDADYGVALKDIAKRAVEAYETAYASATKRYLSEDYWFCQRAIEAGLKVWFCPWMKMSHVGSYVFGGSLKDLAMIGAPATADPSMLRRSDKKVIPQIGVEDHKPHIIGADGKPK